MNSLAEEIKNRCNIVDVVGRYVKLKRSGSGYMGLCPFHSEKTPSFSVSEKGQFYHCFGCGESGDVISFIEKIENVDFMTAARKLSEEYGIDIDKYGYRNEGRNNEIYEMNREAALFFLHQLVDGPNPGLDYITGRGLTMKTIGKFGIGFAPESWNALLGHMRAKGYDEQKLYRAGLISSSGGRYYDKFRNRVIFPIINTRGKVIGFGGRLIGDGQPKYLNSPESTAFSKRNNLFGLNLTRKEISAKDCAIIVEGYMDMVSLYQGGVTNVAATLGTALTKDQCSMLSRYTQNIVLSYDADQAGRNAALRGIEIIRSAGLNARVLHVTDGKDPDDYVRKYGGEAFQKLVDNAAPYGRYRLDSVRSRYDLANEQDRMGYIKDAAAVLADLDPVEAEMYLKTVSAEEGIPEGTLRSEMAVAAAKKRRGTPFQSRAGGNRGVPGNDTEGSGTGRRLQRTLIGVMAAAPETIPKTMEYDKKYRVFTDPVCYRIVSVLFNMFKESGTVDINKAADTMDAADASVFTGIVSAGVLGENVDRVWRECLNKIKTDSLGEKYRVLENELRLMPEDDSRTEEIMNQLSSINSEIRRLRNDLGSEQ